MIVGTDPSFTGLGLVAVPPSWDLDWRRVRAVSLGYGLPTGASARDWLRRTAALADDVCTFVDRVKADRVRIEQQLASGRAFNVPQLSELIGVIRDRVLSRCGIAAELVPQSAARKLPARVGAAGEPQGARDRGTEGGWRGVRRPRPVRSLCASKLGPPRARRPLPHRAARGRSRPSRRRRGSRRARPRVTSM